MLIDKFFKKGRAFLGCKYPIMCGAMTWVSDPKLVSSIGNEGGFGLLAGGNTKVEEFWAGALRQAVLDGDVTSGSLMAGQSVGLVDKIQPLKEIINKM